MNPGRAKAPDNPDPHPAAGGLRRGLGLLPVLGGDLPGLLTYLLVADAQPLQRACGHALVLGCQAEQEMAGTPMALAVPPGLPEGDGDRVAGGAGEGEESGAPGVDAGGVLGSGADGG
jgi:hypothetical protein